MGAYHTIALLLFEPGRGSLRIGLRSKKITAYNHQAASRQIA
jgi:hypothetical protein